MSDTNLKTTVPTAACCGPNCCGGEKLERPAAEGTAVARENDGDTAEGGSSSNNKGVDGVKQHA